MKTVVLKADVKDMKRWKQTLDFISDINGVDSILIDVEQGYITVVGTMNIQYLKLMLQKMHAPLPITFIPAKKDELNKAKSKDQGPLIQASRANNKSVQKIRNAEIVTPLIRRRPRIIYECYEPFNHQQEMMLLCCLFDDNYEFEREKLQQLWIAGSFLSKEPLEYHAQQYFDIMLEKNHIVLSRVDIFTGTKMYKVDSNKLNDALSLMQPIKDFQMRLEGNNVCINSYDNCQHVSLLRENIDQPTFESLKRFKKLKTLLFLNGSSIKQVPSDLFSALKSLTSIDLSGSCITKLPSSIGDVKELCFLDLSWTPIKKLPECIVGLQMLQTLRLKGCKRLFKLPTEMNKLVNLRHLDFDIIGQLDDMPRGIGSLVELCTLTGFIVGVDDEGRCNIIELKHMDNLSGKICIYGLELVTDANDAKAATLGSKDLKQLELRWNDTVQMKNGKNICDEVLACLKPNYGLEELEITCFPGFSLPSWIGNPSYAYLVSITLYKCENCKVLPSLGRLPKLKTLDIVEMNGVKTIDYEMCGTDIARPVFPMLEVLSIDGMFCLECWLISARQVYPCLVKLSLMRCPNLEMIRLVSRLGALKHLEVTDCGSLEYLPDGILLSPLESLTIDACPLLETKFTKGGAYYSMIKHVTNVWISLEDTQSTDEESDDEYSLSTEMDIYDVIREIPTIIEDPAEDNIIIHEGILDKGDKRVTLVGHGLVISTAREIASQDHFVFSGIENSEQGMGTLTTREKVVTDLDTPPKSYEQNVTISMETVAQSTEAPADNSVEDSEAILRKENTEGYNEDRQSTRVTIMKQALLAQTGQHYSGSVYINGNVMQHDSLIRAEKIAGPIKPGDYWYDAKAGFWGVMGHYCLGVIPPGIEEFSSPMPINCSGGNTNICVNGRELHQRDLDLLAARGLPTINNKKYIIDKEGIVLDEETDELIAHIGKLGPIIEREGRGLGMEVLFPRT